MTRSTLKNMGIGFCIFCFVALFVAIERYQANAASVAAMNQMLQSSPFGQISPLGMNSPYGQTAPLQQMTPGIPTATTYAVLLALLSAAGAVVCFAKVKSKTSIGGS